MVEDVATEDLSIYFEEWADFISKAISIPGRVYVHWLMGVSRSATICIAYLMKAKGMRYDAALQHMLKHHVETNPNSGFRKQLQDYDAKLFGCPKKNRKSKTCTLF